MRLLSIIAKIVKITKVCACGQDRKELEHVKNLEGKMSLKDATWRTLRRSK